MLLKKYKSVGRIKEVSEQELATLIGQHKAALLKQALTSQQNKDESSNSES